MRIAAVVVLASCGRLGFEGSTSAHVTVTGAVAVTTLHAQLAFSTLDPDELHALSPQLPASADFALPDDGGPLTVTVTAMAGGRAIVGIGHATVFLHQVVEVDVALEGAYPATCFDAARDGDETDTDCGGSCTGCAPGARCNVAEDCGTTRCVALTCEVASGPPNWVMVAPLPQALLGIGAVLDGDHIRAIGGGPADGIGVTTTYAYDPTIDAWSAGPPLATQRGRTSAAVDAAGNIYVIGGENGTGKLSSVEQLAPGATQWMAAAPLPGPRDSAGATVAADGSIYEIGGLAAGGIALADVEQLGASGWSARTPLPIARGNTAATRMPDGRIAVVGGHDSAETIWYKTAVALDTTANTWTALPDFNHGRSDLAAVTAPDGRVYAIGGFDGNVGVRFIEAYRAGAVGWLDLPSTAEARDGCAATLGPDGRIYVLGGRAAAIATAVVEAYGPRASLDRAAGVAGDAVTITGDNFAASASVIVAVDAVPLEAATTDAAGAFSATFHIPDLGVGAHQVEIIDVRSRYPVHTRLTIQ